MTSKILRVCLIEYEYHSEVVRSLAHFFLDSNWQVTIISNKKCLDDLSDFLSNKDVDLLPIIKNITSNFDLIIFITPFDYNKVSPHIETSLGYILIHNYNYWLRPTENIHFVKAFNKYFIVNLFRYLKHRWRNSEKQNTQFLNSFKGVLVPSKFIYESSNAKEMLSGYLDVSYTRQEEFSLEENEKFTIVIPGTVNHSKNPARVLKMLKVLSGEEKAQMKVILAGENRLLTNSSFISLSTDTFEVVSFDKTITQDQYDTILKSADLGIIVIDKFKNYKGILENRGVSNISGGLFDMYRFGIPFFVPDFYPLIENEEGIRSYKNAEDLKESLRLFILQKKYMTRHSFEKTRNKLFTMNSSMLERLL